MVRAMTSPAPGSLGWGDSPQSQSTRSRRQKFIINKSEKDLVR